MSEPCLPAPFDARPWDDVDLPPDAVAVPTMLTDEEGALLHWLTRDYATGAGAICDLGCFVGGSTARLASGVAAAGRSTKVHAFDHFTLTEAQKERYLYSAGIAPFRGQEDQIVRAVAAGPAADGQPALASGEPEKHRARVAAHRFGTPAPAP